MRFSERITGLKVPPESTRGVIVSVVLFKTIPKTVRPTGYCTYWTAPPLHLRLLRVSRRQTFIQLFQYVCNHPHFHFLQQKVEHLFSLKTDRVFYGSFCCNAGIDHRRAQSAYLRKLASFWKNSELILIAFCILFLFGIQRLICDLVPFVSCVYT